jgi:mycoredoxin
MSDLYNFTPSRIVMYTMDYCGDCKRAKTFFEENQITYLKVGLEDNEEAVKFVKIVNNGNRTVPTIIFPDGSILVEPSHEELKAKFSI